MRRSRSGSPRLSAGRSCTPMPTRSARRIRASRSSMKYSTSVRMSSRSARTRCGPISRRSCGSIRCRSSPSMATERWAISTCSDCRSRRNWVTRTCSRPSTSPKSRCSRSIVTRPTRSSWPGAMRPSIPSRSPTSSTPLCSATARRQSSSSPTSCAHGRNPGALTGERACSSNSRGPASSTFRSSTT